MLESILKKLGVSSVQEFLEREKEIAKRYKGMEIERVNPFSVLTREEKHFFQDYVNSNNLI